MLPIPLSPQPLKIPLFTVFSSIFPCANAGSQLQHIYIRNPSKTFFLTVFPMFPVKQTVIYTFFAIKAVNPSKTLLLTVFVMFPVKHTVIYTFFAITSVQNTCFCSVFNVLASKNPAKSCYVQCFFHFWPFFHCRKATKMTQNSISIPSCAQTPKNPRKMSKTPPYSGLGAKPFLGPPTPAKADIATAILTNVIEHLVLLLPPNKHAFTAKAVWADLPSPFYPHVHLEPVRPWWSELWLLGYQKTWWIWTHTMETGVEIHRNMFWKRLWLVEILWNIGNIMMDMDTCGNTL